MGIGGQVLDALAREHCYKPLKGEALLIGRQTVYFTPDKAISKLVGHGVTPDIPETEIATNKSTIDRLPGYENVPLITDEALLKLFGISNVKALDHSSYEGAEIIHGLRRPLPDRLRECCDILIDGSTLDNMFTPATVLQSYTKLLRPGGRMLLVNAASSFESAYVVMPAMWYVDYFVMNGFADCRAYVMLFKDDRQSAYTVDLAVLHSLKRRMGYFPVGQAACILIFAEKGAHSSWDKLPIQQHYRSSEEWAIYQKNLAVMLSSTRPQLARSTADPLADVQGGYRYLNRDFALDDSRVVHASPKVTALDRVRSVAGRIKRAVIAHT